MADGPMAKKFRIWNPAVSEVSENREDPGTNLQTQDEESPDETPLDCTSKTAQIQFPQVFQVIYPSTVPNAQIIFFRIIFNLHP